MYHDSAVGDIKKKTGFDVNKRGCTLNAVIWSRSVQHGGNCSSVFEKATAGMDLSKATDEEIIRAIYAESGKTTNTPPNAYSKKITAKDKALYNISGDYMAYFSRSDSHTQAGVYNRLHNTELNEALEMLKIYG